MPINSSIGIKIANLRKAHNMTQEQFAEKLDISIKHCSSVERGISCLSLEKLVEVSKLFDVSLDFLIKEDVANTDFTNKVLSNLPQSIVTILASNDEKEIELLREYLYLYTKIKNNYP